MRTLLMLVLLGLIAVAVPAAEADAEALAKATELVSRMKTSESLADAFANAFAADMDNLRRQVGDELQPVLEAGVAKATTLLREKLAASPLAQQQAELYAAAFTSSQLDELLAFYRSPIGQRLVSATPKLSADSFALGQTFMEEVRPELQRLVVGELNQAQADKIAQQRMPFGVEVGKPFPELTMDTTDGGTFSTRAQLGKVVLIDVWATWCQPCLRELPNLLELNQRFQGPDFTVIGLSADQDQEKLASFVAERQIPWKQHCDGLGLEGEIPQRFGIATLPTTFLLGRDGTLVAMDLRGKELAAAVEQALGAPAK